MITFKNFLLESRSAPLYHATNIGRCNSILQSNEMKAFATVPKEKKAISFTRLLQTAFQHGGVMHGKYDTVILEFDQQKLSHNYKLIPFNFWSQEEREGKYRVHKARMSKTDIKEFDMYNEFEERIVDKNIKNVKKYITAIIMKKITFNNDLYDEQRDYFKNCGIPLRLV